MKYPTYGVHGTLPEGEPTPVNQVSPSAWGGDARYWLLTPGCAPYATDVLPLYLNSPLVNHTYSMKRRSKS